MVTTSSFIPDALTDRHGNNIIIGLMLRRHRSVCLYLGKLIRRRNAAKERHASNAQREIQINELN